MIFGPILFSSLESPQKRLQGINSKGIISPWAGTISFSRSTKQYLQDINAVRIFDPWAKYFSYSERTPR